MRHKEAPGGGRALAAAHSSDPVEPEIEERRTQGEKARRTGAVCALLLRVVRGALRNRIGVLSRCGGGTGLSAATGKRPELPGRCSSSLNQRHPLIKGCKSRGSLATPCSQSLGEVARPGSSVGSGRPPEGLHRSIEFPASLGRPPPHLESDRG